MLLYDLWSRSTNFSAHYTEAGIMPLDLVDLNVRNYWGISPYFLSTNVYFLYLIFGYQVFMALCFTLGYKTRFAQFMSWFLMCSLQARNPPVNYGADSLLLLLLFLSLFLPLDETYRLGKSKSNPRFYFSPFNLVYVFQVACLYFFAACSKTGETWWDGSALFMALSLDYYNNSISDFLLTMPLLLKALTYLSLGIEFIAPLLLFHRKSRKLGVVMIAALQFGIMTMMDVGIFPFVSLIALIPLIGESQAAEHIKHEGKLYPVVAFALLALILYSNVINTFNLIPSRLDRALILLELRQTWNMFSPNPPDGDSWFVLSVETENSQRIDLLNRGKAVSNNKPEDFKTWLIDDRWNAYYFKLAYSQNKKYLNRLADYHLEKWNREQGTQYSKAELYMLYQATLPADSQPELKHLLFKGM